MAPLQPDDDHQDLTDALQRPRTKSDFFALFYFKVQKTPLPYNRAKSTYFMVNIFGYLTKI